MIRVDSIEDYKKLRNSGFTGDIIVLFKGGEDNATEAESGTETETGSETGSETGAEAGTETETETETGAQDRVQFNYEKVVNEVYRKILPVIQEGNRNAPAGHTDKDESLNDIMKKLID